MNRKEVFGLGAAALIAGATLAGCSKEQTPSDPVVTQAKEILEQSPEAKVNGALIDARRLAGEFSAAANHVLLEPGVKFSHASGADNSFQAWTPKGEDLRCKVSKGFAFLDGRISGAVNGNNRHSSCEAYILDPSGKKEGKHHASLTIDRDVFTEPMSPAQVRYQVVYQPDEENVAASFNMTDTTVSIHMDTHESSNPHDYAMADDLAEDGRGIVENLNSRMQAYAEAQQRAAKADKSN